MPFSETDAKIWNYGQVHVISKVKVGSAEERAPESRQLRADRTILLYSVQQKYQTLVIKFVWLPDKREPFVDVSFQVITRESHQRLGQALVDLYKTSTTSTPVLVPYHVYHSMFYFMCILHLKSLKRTGRALPISISGTFGYSTEKRDP